MKLLATAFVLLLVALPSSAQQPVSITSEPNAIVWIDEIRRGTTDASGKLSLTKVTPRRHTVRVRATGFKEASAVLLPGRRALSVKLVATTDQAELAFQKAETAREQARDETAREKAAELYRETIKLRPSHAAAHVGLARVLLDLNKFNEALDEIYAAREARAIYPEASAVEGRIQREAGSDAEAIRSFRVRFAKPAEFNPKRTSGSRACWKTKDNLPKPLSSCAKRLTNFPTANPLSTKCSAQLMNDSRSPRKPWRRMRSIFSSRRTAATRQRSVPSSNN